MYRLVGLLLVIALFIVLFFPRWVPRLLRRAGLSIGNLGRVGRELATGEEEPDSPLARYETQAGELVARRVLASHQVSQDEGLQDLVAAIGARLAAGAKRRGIHYRFAVLEDDEPNAFAIPGGRIFITHALLELCERREDEVAGVLGHEVAHVDRRHALHNLATRAVTQAGGRLLFRGRWLAGVATGMEDLVVQGYRRDQEFEADRLGAALAATAGYDRDGLCRLLRALRQRNGAREEPLEKLFTYFSSHPSLVERIDRLQGPKAG